MLNWRNILNTIQLASLHSRTFTILLADDSDDDRLLTREALGESQISNELREVRDGEELMDYLHQRGIYTGVGSAPAPSIILLDLNMPRKSGHEALEEIKSSASLRRIPIIVLTTSLDNEDISRSYDLGASSFICKPTTFEGLVDVISTIGKYWFELCSLPPVQGVP